MKKRKFEKRAVAVACLLALSPVADASFLDGNLTGGFVNTYEDNSREAFIDMDNSGTVTAGDVVIGFVRIDNKSSPNSPPLNNNLYAIFSQQFNTFDGTTGFFKPTTVAGLRLSDIDPIVSSSALFAVYSSTSSATIGNLITTSPGGTLSDYFDKIKLGTLEFTAGFNKSEDFLASTGIIPVTADDASIPGPICTTGILCLGTTASVASPNQGGLSILQDFVAGFDFVAMPPQVFFVGSGIIAGSYQLTLSGATKGASNAANVDDFADASGFGTFNQCQTTANPTGPSIPCGFTDNATFNVLPIAVPEPGSMALLGLGLFGLAGLRRRLNHA